MQFVLIFNIAPKFLENKRKFKTENQISISLFQSTPLSSTTKWYFSKQVSLRNFYIFEQFFFAIIPPVVIFDIALK